MSLFEDDMTDLIFNLSTAFLASDKVRQKALSLIEKKLIFMNLVMKKGQGDAEDSLRVAMCILSDGRFGPQCGDGEQRIRDAANVLAETTLAKAYPEKRLLKLKLPKSKKKSRQI